MKIEQVMMKGVKTVRVWEDLNAAARVLWENDCGCLPVLDQDSRVVAMLTDRDICMAAYTQGKPLGEIPVKTAMSKAIHSCTPQDTVTAAEKVMAESKVRRLPVLDPQGRLVGIVSLNDIAREAVRQKDAMGRDVTEEEVGRTLSRICQARRSAEPAAAAREEGAAAKVRRPGTPKPPAVVG